MQPARQDSPAKRAAMFVQRGGERAMRAAERSAGAPRALIRRSGVAEEEEAAVAAVRRLVRPPQTPESAMRRARDATLRIL